MNAVIRWFIRHIICKILAGPASNKESREDRTMEYDDKLTSEVLMKIGFLILEVIVILAGSFGFVALMHMANL